MPLEDQNELTPQDQKYKDAKYLLSLHLGSFEIEISKIQQLKSKTNKKNYYEYLERSEYINKLHCVLMLDDLTASNTLESIVLRGIHIPDKKAILCSCGYHELAFNENYTYKALICEVALRKTKSLRASEITNEILEDTDFRGEYDSIYVRENDIVEGEKRHPFEKDFVVFRSEQILPMYYVEFTYAKNTTGVKNIS